MITASQPRTSESTPRTRSTSPSTRSATSSARQSRIRIRSRSHAMTTPEVRHRRAFREPGEWRGHGQLRLSPDRKPRDAGGARPRPDDTAGSPANGDTYIVGASATGAWASKDGQIAFYRDGWLFATPKGGMTAFIRTRSSGGATRPSRARVAPGSRTSGPRRSTGPKVQRVEQGPSKALTGITGPGISATVNTAHGISSLALEAYGLQHLLVSQLGRLLRFPGSRQRRSSTRSTARTSDSRTSRRQSTGRSSAATCASNTTKT